MSTCGISGYDCFYRAFLRADKEPIKQRRVHFQGSRMGKEKAQENAAKTIRDIREIIGFKRF